MVEKNEKQTILKSKAQEQNKLGKIDNNKFQSPINGLSSVSNQKNS